MVSYTKLSGISLALETADGVYTSPFTAANSSYLAIEPDLRFTPETFTRNIRRGTLTPQQPLIGAKGGKLTFGLEMTGTGGSAVPQIGLPLQACGMRQELLGAFTIGAVGGTGSPYFKHGERINQAGGAVVTCVGDTYNGQTTLFFYRLNGGGANVPTATGALTGATSGATATPSAVLTGGNVGTGAGYGWWPASFPLMKLTFTANISSDVDNGDILTNGNGKYMQAVGDFTAATTLTLVLARARGIGTFADGDTISNYTANPSSPVAVGTLAGSGTGNVQLVIPSLSAGQYKDGVLEAMKGARGTWKMDGKVGEPMILSFDMSGGFQSVTDGPNPGSTSPFISYNQSLPPTLLDADIGLGKVIPGDTPPYTPFGSEFAACINNFGIDIANTVAPRRCMNDPSGIVSYQITGRNGVFTIDPEQDLEVVWDYIAQFMNGTSTRARLTVGSALGNKFFIQCPAVSFTDIPSGDRDGVATRQITGSLNSGSQTSLSGDNEVVIIYQYLAPS